MDLLISTVLQPVEQNSEMITLGEEKQDRTYTF